MKINPKGMEKRDDNGPQHRMARQRLVLLGCKCRVSFFALYFTQPHEPFFFKQDARHLYMQEAWLQSV